MQGPLTDDEAEAFYCQDEHWTLAAQLFWVVAPGLTAGDQGASMEGCVSLLRALRFASVVSMLM